jgi:hypothetical protein
MGEPRDDLAALLSINRTHNWSPSRPSTDALARVGDGRRHARGYPELGQGRRCGPGARCGIDSGHHCDAHAGADGHTSARAGTRADDGAPRHPPTTRRPPPRGPRPRRRQPPRQRRPSARRPPAPSLPHRMPPSESPQRHMRRDMLQPFSRLSPGSARHTSNWEEQPSRTPRPRRTTSAPPVGRTSSTPSGTKPPRPPTHLDVHWPSVSGASRGNSAPRGFPHSSKTADMVAWSPSSAPWMPSQDSR